MRCGGSLSGKQSTIVTGLWSDNDALIFTRPQQGGGVYCPIKNSLSWNMNYALERKKNTVWKPDFYISMHQSPHMLVEKALIVSADLLCVPGTALERSIVGSRTQF